MNEIVNRFLLAGDKFIPEMHLRQPGFTYGACGPFTKNKKRIQKFKEIKDSRYIYQNELDKVSFQHDMTYGDQLLIKYCMIKHLILLKIQNMMDINMDLLQFFDKKASGGTVENEVMSNKELAEELHKPIIRKLKKEKYTHRF